MTGLPRLGLAVDIAIGSLVSHRRRSLFVGGILALGTALVMVGLALLDSIEGSMAAGITESLAGDLQVYSTEGRDRLALFGGRFMGIDDIGRIEDVGEARAVIESVPGVKAVVPMGVDFASISAPGELESLLAELRAAVHAGRPIDPQQVGRVRELVELTKSELERRLEITAEPEKTRSALDDVEAATTDEFWDRFDESPLDVLETLDTRVAVHSQEGDLIYFRYLGTDLPAFAEEFERFELVEGEPIPPNTRGLLFNQKFHEQQVKHPVARGLDRLHRMLTEQELSLESDPLARTIRRRVAEQWRRVTVQLGAARAAELRALLAEQFAAPRASLESLVQQLLTVDDDNFLEHYASFYEHVAPRIDLYEVDVGDVVTVRTFTRMGFLKSVNVRLYGIFRFAGLDSSDLAGSNNIVDMITFRELYGLMTPARARELDEIRESVGVQDVGREEAEAELFGSDDTLVDDSAAVASFDEFEGVDLEGLRGRADRVVDAEFSPADVESGIALNMAVLLEPGRDRNEVERELEAALENAGMPLQVVTWQEASGLIGQFITVIRFVLYIAIVIIFAVALVIINNSTVTATLERIPEIGTMRAIGAQRGMVLGLFIIENTALALVSGVAGVVIGTGVMLWLGAVGIPAWQQVLVFLFGGPRLYPSFGPEHAALALVAVTLVTVISALYPAQLAARVQPIEAMQDRD
jgi:ABC-type lipoprotein release transport system permease subunit